MKHLFTIILLVLVSLQVFSQRTSDLKIGLGLPLFTGVKYTHGSINTLNALPVLFVEKPIPIKIDRKEKFSFNPGLAFFYFMEDEEWGTEVAGGSKDLSHYSFNGYTKILFNQKLKRRSEAYIYFGGIAGVHIVTQTVGTREAHSDSEVNSNFTEPVKQKGNAFFNSAYYGAVAGFQPNAKITNRYKLSFEVSFLPSFVTMETGKTHAIQLSVLLGINR